MDMADFSHRLRALTAELDEVRRSLMADDPRRQTYMQVVKAKAGAEVYLFATE